jgi:hypothetical protein
VISPIVIPDKAATGAAPTGSDTATSDVKATGEKQEAAEEDKNAADTPAQTQEPKR